MIPQIAIIEQYEDKKEYNYCFIVPKETRPVEKKGKKRHE